MPLVYGQRSKDREGNKPNALPQNENKNLPQSMPPGYEESPRALDQDLAGIREQYWLHRQELDKIESEKPRGGAAMARWDLLQCSHNLQGKTLAWEDGKKACAARGGCCGRGCGCCSKPLTEYTMPGSLFGKKSRIYGHCTVECPCCIRARGFYKPDPANALPSIQSRK